MARQLLGTVVPDTADVTLDRFSSLHDWRRQVADLYAAVRAMPAGQGWQHWRSVRDRLFREHPQSPLAESKEAPSFAASTALPTTRPALQGRARAQPSIARRSGSRPARTG
jgi:hypothetical protein